MIDREIYMLNQDVREAIDDLARNMEAGIASPEAVELFEQKMAASEEVFRGNAKAYIEAISVEQLYIDQINTELTRLKALKTSRTKLVERINRSMLHALHTFGIDDMDLGTHKLKITQSRSVTVLDESQIPKEYINLEPKPNKSLISKKLKLGEIIPGTELTVNKNLRIK